MRVARGLLLVVLGCLLVWTAGPSVADEEPVALGRWRDPEVLRSHLEAACNAVERVCRDRFRERPTVRVSQQEDVRRILRERVEGEQGMLETTPDDTRKFLAYYEPTTHEIHILPDAIGEIAAFFQVPELLEEDVLRVVLVHEATHALDFQRFPVRWTLACCAASDERIATEALLEGHAQLVTEEVSRRWHTEKAFQTLTRLYTGALFGPREPELMGLDQEAAFTYIQGHAFMRTIQTVRGSRGVDAALRDPPFETRVIDRPMLWLEPERRAREPDLQALLEIFRPLVPNATWEVSKWRVLGPAVPMLAAEGTGGEGVVESYLDNHGLFAGAPGGNQYINAFIAYCRSEYDADRFVRTLRNVDVARDDDPDWEPAVRTEGAGVGGHLKGFTSRRRAIGHGRRSELTLHVVRQGRHVIEFSAYGISQGERARQALTLDLVARLLRAPPPTAAAVALRAHVSSFLTARAMERVPDARVLLRDLLPTRADLRRVVRPEYAERFSDHYQGVRLALRTTEVPNATVYSAFARAAPDSLVRAWAATTKELAEGKGESGRFPAPMRAFARDVAAPGVTWIVLVLTAPEGEALTFACFARFGDRFLWIRDPWDVSLEEK